MWPDWKPWQRPNGLWYFTTPEPDPTTEGGYRTEEVAQEISDGMYKQWRMNCQSCED